MSVINRSINILPLSVNNVQIIINGEWLTDDHIEYFHKLLEANSNYKPRETWRIQLLDTIQPVPEYQDHIQILHQSEKLEGMQGDIGFVASINMMKKEFIFMILLISRNCIIIIKFFLRSYTLF